MIFGSRRYFTYFFWVQTNLSPRKFLVQENFGSKKCMVQKKLQVQQNFGLKIFGAKKMLRAKNCVFKIFLAQSPIRQPPNTFHKCSIHLTDTLQTSPKTLQTLLRYPPETFQTPYRHNQDTLQTPSRPTLDNHKKPVKEDSLLTF